MTPNVSDQLPTLLVGCIGWLCCRFKMVLPSGEHQNGGMALECACDHFGAFDPKAHAIVLNRRKRCLWYPGARGELILAKALQLADDADGLANGNINALFSGTKLTHYGLR